MLIYSLASILHGCGDPEEAARVDLPVVLDASGIKQITNNLGYSVTLTGARLMMENLAFTVAGEAHTASLGTRVSNVLVPSAYAHPGHFQGGEVNGELRGRFELNWFDARTPTIGVATLLLGTYKGANFTFTTASESDGLPADDPLIGHTAILEGTATKDAQTFNFSVTLDAPENRDLMGAFFEFVVTETTTAELGLRLLTQDSFEDETLFDDINFMALDSDGDGQVTILPATTTSPLQDAYNQIRRTFQTHDHFDIQTSAINQRSNSEVSDSS